MLITSMAHACTYNRADHVPLLKEILVSANYLLMKEGQLLEECMFLTVEDHRNKLLLIQAPMGFSSSAKKVKVPVLIIRRNGVLSYGGMQKISPRVHEVTIPHPTVVPDN